MGSFYKLIHPFPELLKRGWRMRLFCELERNMVRIQSNSEVYDFELDKGDMEALDGLDEGAKGASTWNPVDAE
jgi:hypothetical protein